MGKKVFLFNLMDGKCQNILMHIGGGLYYTGDEENMGVYEEPIYYFGDTYYELVDGNIKLYYSFYSQKHELPEENVKIYFDKENNKLHVETNINEEINCDFEKKNYEIIKRKEPVIGMTEDEVKKSTWGSTNDINRTTTSNGVTEQWCYTGYRYIYFRNGIVTSIQD